MNLNNLVAKGILWVYGPLVSFVAICGTFSFWISKKIFESSIADFYAFITTFSAIGIGWIWWSYKVVKWKLWAFSQLEIEEADNLYSKAVNAGLIWPTGSIFNKTEIWLKKDKEKFNQLPSDIRKLIKNEK